MIQSDLSKFAIRYHGVVIWNGIRKLGIDNDTSEAVFVKLLKMYYNSKATIVTQSMIMFVSPLRIEYIPI